jgi:hypothetical protein
MAKRIEQKGGTPAAEPAGYAVQESEGPLTPGEMDRAQAWARGMEG